MSLDETFHKTHSPLYDCAPPFPRKHRLKLHAFLLGQTGTPTIDTREIYRDLVEDTQAAQEWGYDCAWFAEHHFSNYVLVPNSLTLIAALSRETDRIRLGTGIVLLPLRNPTYVAEEIAMVDQLSEGRLNVGFGRGYQPYEFDQLGIDFEQAGSRLADGLDLVTHFFTKRDQPFASAHANASGFTLTPSCRQTPHPPFWVACGSRQSMGMALDRGCNVIINVGHHGPKVADQMLQVFEEECAVRSIERKKIRFGLQMHAGLVENDEQRQVALRSAAYLHRMQVRLREKRARIVEGVVDTSGSEKTEPTYDEWSSGCMVGDPRHIERQMSRFRTMGVDDLLLTYRFGEFTTEGTRRSMKFIAECSQ